MTKRPRGSDVILLALAGWYVQHVVRWEQGPADIFESAKATVFEPKAEPSGLRLFLQSLYNCIFCAGPYAGVAVLVLWLICPLLIVPFAIAGAIVMIDKYVRHN